ncbi:MAG: TolC family protein [Planctomycetota bacterium]
MKFRTISFSSIGVLFLCIGFGGCTSIHEDNKTDRRNLHREIQKRTGVDLTAPGDSNSEEAVTEEVKHLLSKALTEESAVRIAILNNREFRELYETLGVSRAALIQAGILTNPVFEANAKFFRGATEIELGIAESFLDIFLMPLRKRIAESEFEVSRARVTRELIHLIFDVRRAFVKISSARKILEIYGKMRDTARASYDLMKELHKAGNVTDPELTTEEIILSHAKLEHSSAHAKLYESREVLNRLLGLWGRDILWTESADLPETFNIASMQEHVENRSISKSLNLAENRARIEASARRGGIVDWETFMNADLGLAAKRETAGDWGIGPAVRVPIPIFDRGGARSAEAAAQTSEYLHHHAVLAVEIRSMARVLRERLITFVEQADYIKNTHLPLRARLVRETLQNFNAMQIGAFEVLAARREEVDAEREYIESLCNARIAKLDLEELLAGNFVEH